MPDNMQKTPSYLKGLAETRARADSVVIRSETLLETLRQNIAEHRAELAEAEAMASKVLVRKPDAERSRESCDVLRYQ